MFKSPDPAERDQRYDHGNTEAGVRNERWIGFAVGYLLFIGGIGIVGWQVFIFLKVGQWVEVPLFSIAFLAPNSIQSWLNDPTTWLGLHKIVMGVLEGCPLSCPLIIFGLGFYWYSLGPHSRVDD